MEFSDTCELYMSLCCVIQRSLPYDSIQKKSIQYNKAKIIVIQVAGPDLGARSGVRNNITHRKHTEKIELKMATMAPK